MQSLIHGNASLSLWIVVRRERLSFAAHEKIALERTAATKNGISPREARLHVSFRIEFKASKFCGTQHDQLHLRVKGFEIVWTYHQSQEELCDVREIVFSQSDNLLLHFSMLLYIFHVRSITESVNSK